MTLSISDKTKGAEEKKLVRHALAYALLMSFLMVFGAVYELFSHQVFSYYMIYACAIPLVMGLLPSLLLLILKKPAPESTAGRLWTAGIITLSTGCVYKGILDIYGTTNQLLVVYLIAGGLLIAAALARMLIRRQKVYYDTEEDSLF